MRASKEMTKQVARQLTGFQKESHAESLASGIIRRCNNDPELQGKIEKANSVVSAVMGRGVTSFFAAEYAKVFTKPEQAMATRERIMAEMEVQHGLTPKHSAKMADCVVFAAAKKSDLNAVEALSRMVSAALGSGAAFDVVADAVYYAPTDVTPADLARRIVATSLKKNKPMDVSEIALSHDLASSLSA